MKRINQILLLLLLIPILGLSAESYRYGSYGQSSDTDILESFQNATRGVAKEVIPSVVSIDAVNVVEAPNRTSPFGSPFEFFFGIPDPNQERDEESQPREYRQTALGSGVIVGKEGETVHVLTNNHVVGKAKEIKIHLSDGRTFQGELLGSDPRRDIALVEFSTRESVPVARLGDSDQVEVGDLSFAIGNPLGFDSTFTSGVISAVGREGGQMTGTSFTDYIQTDAAINPGNSGGALVNIKGEVIGINTWIASRTGGNVGIGFAIPINSVKMVLNDLITSGKVEYGWLGVSIGDPSEQMKEEIDLNGKKGAFVYNVYQDSPAWEGGIRPGDFITTVDGRSIDSGNNLVKVVGTMEPGKRYLFTVIRDGKNRNIRVRISSREEESTIREQAKKLWPGLTVAPITDEIQERLKLPRNIGKVLIATVAEGSPAHQAGLRSGDVVKEINKEKIDSVSEFYRTLNGNDRVEELIFRVNRQGTDILLGIVK